MKKKGKGRTCDEKTIGEKRKWKNSMSQINNNHGALAAKKRGKRWQHLKKLKAVRNRLPKAGDRKRCIGRLHH